MWKIITAVASFFCLMIIVIGILLANAKRGTDVPLEIAKGLISLEVAILITGVLSYFLSERVRKQAEKAEKDREVQAKRAEEERLLVSALQDLKSAYSKVQVVQFSLRAERSPMRLREQIPALIEPRAQLQHLRHERIIRDDEYAVMSIKKMTNYINTLGVEYARNLPTVTHDCLAFEREMQSYLRGDTDDAPSVPILYMEALPNLEEFLGEQVKYSQFQKGYDQAKSWIEERLSRRLAS